MSRIAAPTRTASPAERLDRWLDDRVSTDEVLDPDTLARLAIDLGRDEALWRHEVRHDDTGRVSVLLHRDANLDVWLLCWNGFHETGFHDHDASAGATYLCSGELVEEAIVDDGFGGLRAEATRRSPGSTLSFDSGYIHRVAHDGTRPATSLHLYSPPLTHMGHLEAGRGGLVGRVVRPNEYVPGAA